MTNVIDNYKSSRNWEKGFWLGLFLAVAYILIITVDPVIHGSLFWNCSGTFGCYLKLLPLYFILGLPMEIYIILVSMLLGFLMGKIYQSDKIAAILKIIFSVSIIIIAIILFILLFYPKREIPGASFEEDGSFEDVITTE